MGRRLSACPVGAKSKRRVCRLIPVDDFVICEQCVRDRVSVLCSSERDDKCSTAGLAGVVTDGLSHVAILLARLRGLPIEVGGDDIFLAVGRMYWRLDALVPSVAPDAQVPLQCEIDRLDRIGQIMVKPYDVAARLELVLQAGELAPGFRLREERLERSKPEALATPLCAYSGARDISWRAKSRSRASNLSEAIRRLSGPGVRPSPPHAWVA